MAGPNGTLPPGGFWTSSPSAAATFGERRVMLFQPAQCRAQEGVAIADAPTVPFAVLVWAVDIALDRFPTRCLSRPLRRPWTRLERAPVPESTSSALLRALRRGQRNSDVPKSPDHWSWLQAASHNGLCGDLGLALPPGVTESGKAGAEERESGGHWNSA